MSTLNSAPAIAHAPLSLRARFAPYVVVFLHLLAVGALKPTFSLFITDELGYRPWLVGLALSTFGVGSLVSSIPGGVVGDRIGPRAVVIVGTSVLGFSGFLLGIAPTIIIVIIALTMQGMGNGIYMPNLLNVLRASTAQHEYGKTMSKYSVVGRSGGIVGPTLGGIVVAAVGLRGPLFLYGLLCTVASFIAISSFPRISRTDGQTPASAPVAIHLDQIQNLLPSIRMFLDVLKAGLIGLIVSISEFGIVLTVLALFYSRMALFSTAQIGLIFSANALGSFVLSAVSGPVSDRAGRKRVIGLGLCLLTATTLLIPFLTHPLTAVVINFLFGAIVGALRPVLLALIADSAPKDHVATAMGLFQAMTGGGHLIGPLFAGVIMDYYGVAAPFFSLAVISVIGIGISLSLRGAVIGEPAPRGV